MPAHRLAILSARRSGADAVLRLLGPALGGPTVGAQPFHWDNAWGEVSREFHQGSPERARGLLDEALGAGALFRHCYDAESWDFNQMLLDALAQAGYHVLFVERAPSVEHLFSIIVADAHDCSDAAAVVRLRERLQAGEELATPSAQELRQRIDQQWQTHQWFERAVGACAASVLVCRYERLFLRGVAGLAAVDEMFAFAGLGPREAAIDDASLLRFLWSGQHYTAGLAAWSPALLDLRRGIESELARLQAQQPAPAEAADARA
ncbi:hypothetical protein [Ideonella sp. YS5]|uniref:hypothetical protein n=1 Tax=Ideonella sp. YS5 TaxID=3453714 RepID=UPI003EF07F56